MFKNTQKKMPYSKSLTYGDYIKVVNTIGSTFNLFQGFILNGYANTLVDSLQENYKIVAPESEIEDIVIALTYRIDNYGRISMKDEFYELGFFQKPLLSFTNESGEAMIISFPELIQLSSKMYEIYDFPASPVSENIKTAIAENFNKFMRKQIEITDKRYNVRYFKYKNNFEYTIPAQKKGESDLEFEQVMYDIAANYLFFSKNFFFRNEPIL